MALIQSAWRGEDGRLRFNAKVSWRGFSPFTRSNPSPLPNSHVSVSRDDGMCGMCARDVCTKRETKLSPREKNPRHDGARRPTRGRARLAQNNCLLLQLTLGRLRSFTQIRTVDLVDIAKCIWSQTHTGVLNHAQLPGERSRHATRLYFFWWTRDAFTRFPYFRDPIAKNSLLFQVGASIGAQKQKTKKMKNKNNKCLIYIFYLARGE